MDNKLAYRLQAWRGISNGQFWSIVKQDLEDMSRTYKSSAMAYLQQGKREDAERQSHIAEGIDEVLVRQQYLEGYLKPPQRFADRIRNEICKVCGSIIRKLEQRK